MASLTEERLKEMEDEMDRFEQEILTTKAAAAAAAALAASNEAASQKMIIGAGTYNQVQAQLAGMNPEPAEPENIPALQNLVFAGPLLPPPPPPPIEDQQQGPMTQHRDISAQFDPSLLNLQPPPPPPPPCFMPPQLRRPMPPRPPFMARPPGPPRMMPGPPQNDGGPGMMMPPPPPPPHMLGRPPIRNNFMGPGPNQMGPGPQQMGPPQMGGPPGPPQMGGPGPRMMPPGGMFPPPRQPTGHFYPPSLNQMMANRLDPSSSSSNVIEKPKVVYSAPPVRRVPTTTDAPATTKPLHAAITSTVEIVKPVVTNLAAPTPTVPQPVAPGIELNVPVEKIEAEKMKNTRTVPKDGETTRGAEGQEGTKKEKKEKKKKFVRMAAGTVWEDQTLGEWDPDDFRLFCGDLGNEVSDDTLARAFSKYPSFRKAKVVRDKRTNKTKGFGFVSFKDPNDFMKAMREMNGKYVGNRPIKLRKSCWKDRQMDIVKKKDREKKKLGFR